jgi:hypothetical protein
MKHIEFIKKMSKSVDPNVESATSRIVDSRESIFDYEYLCESKPKTEIV